VFLMSEVPLYGTCKTVKPRFWPRISDRIPYEWSPLRSKQVRGDDPPPPALNVRSNCRFQDSWFALQVAGSRRPCCQRLP